MSLGPKNPDPVARFFGAVLIAIGALIGGLSGLCTLTVAGFGLAAGNYSDAMSILPYAVIVGGPFILIGVGLFLAGRALWRGPRKRA